MNATYDVAMNSSNIGWINCFLNASCEILKLFGSRLVWSCVCLASRQHRAYSSNRPPLPPTGGADIEEEPRIYDSVPDQPPDEEDIYGSLVSYQGKGKTQQGSGFGGLPEKMGFVVAEIVETEKNYLEALNLLTKVSMILRVMTAEFAIFLTSDVFEVVCCYFIWASVIR